MGTEIRAHSLQIHAGMKWTVAIVAASLLGLIGCGVGVDDPEGMAAAGYDIGTSASALTEEEPSEGEDTSTGGSASTTGTAQSKTSLKDPGTVSAPQDPIPAVENQPAPVTDVPFQTGPTYVPFQQPRTGR